jgi:hypothetical protein
MKITKDVEAIWDEIAYEMARMDIEANQAYYMLHKAVRKHAKEKYPPPTISERVKATSEKAKAAPQKIVQWMLPKRSS